MSNQFPPPVVPGDDDDDALIDAPDVLAGDLDDERPLDPDLDADAIDSAAADERAASAGTLDGDIVDDRP